MRVLKWLFQPAYLLLIIVLVALYINRDTVFPEEVARSLDSDRVVSKVEGLAERLRDGAASFAVRVEQENQGNGEIASAEAATAVSPTNAAITAIAEPAAEPVTESVTEQAAASSDELTHDETTVTLESATEVSSDAGVAVPSDSPADGMVIAETDNVATLDADTENAGADFSALPASDNSLQEGVSELPLQLWQAARRAVWQGELALAVNKYQQLIELQPGNFDAYGEMGNVLLAQYDVDGASEAYANAARLIHRSGHWRMATQVTAIVAQLDPDKAAELQAEFLR